MRRRLGQLLGGVLPLLPAAAPQGVVLVDEDPAQVPVHRALVPDPVPRQVELGERRLHQVLGGVPVAGQQVRRAQDARLAGLQVRREVGVAGGHWQSRSGISVPGSAVGLAVTDHPSWRRSRPRRDRADEGCTSDQVRGSAVTVATWRPGRRRRPGEGAARRAGDDGPRGLAVVVGGLAPVRAAALGRRRPRAAPGVDRRHGGERRVVGAARHVRRRAHLHATASPAGRSWSGWTAARWPSCCWTPTPSAAASAGARRSTRRRTSAASDRQTVGSTNGY